MYVQAYAAYRNLVLLFPFPFEYFKKVTLTPSICHMKLIYIVVYLYFQIISPDIEESTFISLSTYWIYY